MAHRMFPSAQPSHQLKHPLEWPCHHHRDACNGKSHQHRGHAPLSTVALGRAWLQDGGPSLARDCAKCVHWPLGQRGMRKDTDFLKRSLVTCNIDYCEWTRQAVSYMAWHWTVNHVTFSFKQGGGKTETVWRPPLNRPWCHCGNTCLSQIGFISHQSTHFSFMNFYSQSRLVVWFSDDNVSKNKPRLFLQKTLNGIQRFFAVIKPSSKYSHQIMQ